jgi:CarboxypepD_reg-like domain/Gram-negative bacterial TonB protein C-terminal
MAIDNNIKSFTAADIEKYHKGLLSNKEMHDLEKAALEDGFLAEAMEGYTTPGVNVVADITDLQKRLAEKIANNKTVPLYAAVKKPFPWLRVAAAVLIVGGAALLANQFILNKNKNSELAVVTDTKETNTTIKDSATENKAATVTNNGETKTEENAPVKIEQSSNVSVKAEDEIGTKGGSIAITPEVGIKQTENIATEGKTKSITVIPAPVATETVARTEDFLKAPGSPQRKEVISAKDKQDRQYKAERDVAAMADAEKVAATNAGIAVAPAKKTITENKAPVNTNNAQTSVFRGRITDAGNTGLPFAKVYNPTDNNAGTYTDANGYFTITYPDTTLNVQIRALGYQNTNVRLQTNLMSNKVVLQDDKNISPLVISNRQVNTNMRSANNMSNRQLLEPEPTDGWQNYDAYIANNLETPDELITSERKKGGTVQISFEVGKNGEPINISVDKSLCSSCDKEAIRLIKEGPKWRSNANKHGRTTVTINF